MSHLAPHSPLCKSVFSKSFANLTFQTAPSRQKLCPSPCPLSSQLPPYHRLPLHLPPSYVPNTSASKKQTISCPLCTSSASPHLETLAVQMHFLLENLVQGSFPRHSPSHLSNCQFIYHPTYLFPRLSIYFLLSVACFYS